MNWEMFQDYSFYDMYAVRPIGDKNYNSPRLFHFNNKQDAEDFLKLVEKAHISIEGVKHE